METEREYYCKRIQDLKCENIKLKAELQEALDRIKELEKRLKAYEEYRARCV